MKSFTTLLKKVRKPSIFIPLLIIVIILISIGFFANSKKESQAETAVVNRGSLQDSILINGTVRAAQNVELAVERGGRVTSVGAQVGDRVAVGTMLVSTNAGNASAALARAEASLSRELTELEALTGSARNEELLIARGNVESALAEEVAARADLARRIEDSYITADDAIRNTVDRHLEGSIFSPRVVFPVSRADLRERLEDNRREIEYTLLEYKDSVQMLDEMTISSATLNQYASYVQQISAYVNDMAAAVNGLQASDQYPALTINGWKEDLAQARTSLTTTQRNLTDAERRIRTAQAGVRNARQELQIKETGGSDTDVRAQEAAVAQARADVAQARADVSDTMIRAPFSGIITRVDVEVGETIAANQRVISIISEGALEIEANIPEVTVSRVTVGDEAIITLDAYGSGETFKAVVSSIDLSGTEIDGVQSYATRLQFTNADERIKVGMTANVQIITDIRTNVLSVPKPAVTNKDGMFYVKRVTDIEKKVGQNYEEVPVEVGLSTDVGVEVISGLREGDIVIVKE